LPVFAGLMAVLPAAFALWSGWRIAAFADDPAIAERLLANRTRGGLITGFCGAILVTTAVHQLAWALPLLIVARMAAGYPLRKELYRESWSLAAYLFFFVRLVFAVFGYSLLLAMTPSLVRLADRATGSSPASSRSSSSPGMKRMPPCFAWSSAPGPSTTACSSGASPAC
jgi:hypothetical protein